MNLRRSCLPHNYARHVYPQLLPAFLLIITIIAVGCVAFLFPPLELLNIHTDAEKDQKPQLHITFFCFGKKTKVLGQTKMPAQRPVTEATIGRARLAVMID